MKTSFITMALLLALCLLTGLGHAQQPAATQTPALSGNTPAIPPAPPAPTPNGQEAVLTQLQCRVKESAEYLDRLIWILQILVAIVALVGGGGAVALYNMVKHTIDKHFAAKLVTFNQEINGKIKIASEDLDTANTLFHEKIQNDIKERRREFDDLYSANIDNLLEAYRLMWEFFSTGMGELDAANLPPEMTQEQRETELRRRARLRRRQYEVAYYRVQLRSNKADDVVNAAQQLSAMGERAEILALREALQRWENDPAVMAALSAEIRLLESPAERQDETA